MGTYTEIKVSRVKDILIKFDKFLRNLNVFSFIVTILFFQFLSIILMEPILNFLPDNNGAAPFSASDKIAIQVVFGIIIAPLYETLIYQKLIISICDKIKFLSKRKYLIVLISGVIFGSRHTYSLQYVFHMIIVGIIWAYAYVIYKEKRKYPYWVVCTIHVLNNLIALLVLNF
ncbi:CPBP family intramembrane glutamic endopeptidase [Tepidibacter thalassicus]|uniref:CAAX protease self-immunity n=1 Tax=Tepidibacter thalassicus DSM 15285 TaxID=1123350 RepID=A0A1M5S9W9_9FIRM|nr:CPBP family intramembrane glutamic endopeptidase [Tepidibacter thalassicus]SHH35279.1 CAAX protease self-immunity [Tepidibacter thalassicus DSM 15285]